MAPKHVVVIIPVFRDYDRARQTVAAILRCSVPSPFSVRVHVVDDGSGDGTAERLSEQFGGRIEIIGLPENLGRSAARNAGATNISADLLLFVDADCEPSDDRFLAAHLLSIREADVSMGVVEGQDDGFWHAYQQAARVRRDRLARRTFVAHFTTQNVMIDARLFNSVGGFDEAFKGYGFEDRDLAIRLARAGARFTIAPGARVIHRDTLDLAQVCRKMGEAGATTSQIFASRYPFEYRTLGYEAIDGQRHPWRGVLAKLLWPVFQPWTQHDAWLQWRLVPFKLRAGIVRIMVAVSYLRGTLRRHR